MRCKSAQKLIYLKTDELKDSQHRRLAAHLKKCSDCASRAEKMAEYWNTIETLDFEPHLSEPKQLTIEIMSRIGARTHAQKSFMDNLLDLLLRKKVRLAMVSLSFALVGLFCVQEVMLLTRLQRLETRIARQQSIRHSASPLSILKEKVEALPASESSDTVVIDKEALQELLQFYGELQLQNRLLLNRLRKKELAQVGVSLDDGLTQKELQSLMDHEPFVKKIKNL